MFFLGEGTRKVVPSPPWSPSLLGLNALFCWVIDGVHRSLHGPEVPGSVSRGALKAAFAFLASAICGRHEDLGFCWFGFGEFVTLGRKTCSFSKDMQELSGDAWLREAGSGTCCRRTLRFDRCSGWCRALVL